MSPQIGRLDSAAVGLPRIFLFCGLAAGMGAGQALARDTAQKGAGEHLRVRGQQPAPAGLAAEYRAKNADLGPLGTRAIADAPFSITEVRRDALLNWQVRSLSETVKFSPSVQLEQRGDPNLSRLQSRGFESDVISNSRIDGLNAIATTPYAAEQFDHLTVLNGLSGALYGPQNPAGMMDYALKRPTDAPMLTLNAGADSGGAPLESLDVSDRYKAVAGRLNLLNQTGQGYADRSHLWRNMVSGDFDIHLDKKTTLYLDGSQFSGGWRGMPGAFTFVGSGPEATTILPRAPDAGKAGYGQKQGGYNVSTSTGLARLEHVFNRNWRLRLGGLYQNAGRNIFDVNNQLIGNTGAYRQTIAAASTARDFKTWSNFAYLNGRFRLWKMTHNPVFGSSGYDLRSYSPLWTDCPAGSPGMAGAGKPPVCFLGTARMNDPKVWAGGQPRAHGRYKSAETRVQDFIAGDTLEVTRKLSLIGMLSWSWIRVRNLSKTGAASGGYLKSAAFSPMAGATYKPVRRITAYFNWAKAIQPGMLAPSSATNRGQTVSAMRSEQYEAGVKYQPVERLLLTLDVFKMTRPYAFQNPVTGVYGNFGRQRSYGLEFMASGHVTEDLSIMAGATWLDPQLKHLGQLDSGGIERAGRLVVGVPRVNANVMMDYRLPFKKSFLRQTAVTASVHYTGRRAADVYNETHVPDYVTLDLGLRYAVRLDGKMAVWRFGVNNVTGERYWASVFPTGTAGSASNASSTLMAGLPRTYQGTFTISF